MTQSEHEPEHQSQTFDQIRAINLFLAILSFYLMLIASGCLPVDTEGQGYPAQTVRLVRQFEVSPLTVDGPVRIDFFSDGSFTTSISNEIDCPSELGSGPIDSQDAALVGTFQIDKFDAANPAKNYCNLIAALTSIDSPLNEHAKSRLLGINDQLFVLEPSDLNVFCGGETYKACYNAGYDVVALPPIRETSDVYFNLHDLSHFLLMRQTDQELTLGSTRVVVNDDYFAINNQTYDNSIHEVLAEMAAVIMTRWSFGMEGATDEALFNSRMVEDMEEAQELGQGQHTAGEIHDLELAFGPNLEVLMADPQTNGGFALLNALAEGQLQRALEIIGLYFSESHTPDAEQGALVLAELAKMFAKR